MVVISRISWMFLVIGQIYSTTVMTALVTNAIDLLDASALNASQIVTSNVTGADVTNDPLAAKQDELDQLANKIALVAPLAPKGGIGGIDPATGETLLPLPLVSEFCQAAAVLLNQSVADGTQIAAGFCSSVPQGSIPQIHNMVSTIITKPRYFEILDRNKTIDIRIVVRNLDTGFFANAAREYYTQPQTLNARGQIKGHSHIVVQYLGDGFSPPHAEVKDFFLGLNDQGIGKNGLRKLSAVVPAATLNATGTYRACTMAGSFSHQPVVMPVAQRGAQDDCVRFFAGMRFEFPALRKKRARC